MPERPLECSECHLPIAVLYTESVGGKIVEQVHCDVCPVLHRKLYGIRPEEGSGAKAAERTGICCGRCGTTLESVRTGSPLGCSECYEAFADVIVFILSQAKRISQRLEAPPSTRVSLHVGRQPGEAPTINLQMKLIALHEALDETLKREDYEQAAMLRDQIKAIEEGIDEGKEG